MKWERREVFGVKGLADGVAELVEDFEDCETNSRRSLSFQRSRSGLYAPDVVFEGGMARCPWEVGLHIPSGSSGSDAGSDHIQEVPETIEMETQKPVKQNSPVARRRSSSVSYVPSRSPSPSPSIMIETADVPPPTPAKAEAEAEQLLYERISPVSNRANFASRWSQTSSAGPGESIISEIRFASPSDEEPFSSSASSGSSSSSSASSSIGSEASATRTPGNVATANPRVSDVDVTLGGEEDAYAYAIMAALESPADTEMDGTKVPYSETYVPQQGYEASRRSRFRMRSRGRQPYPQPSSRDPASRRRSKFQVRRQRPELKLNVDNLQSFPQQRGGADNPQKQSANSSSVRSVLAVRHRAQEKPVSSCPFAYSVSRSASFIPGPDMDVDALYSALQESERQPDYDVHMISPSVIQGEDDEDTRHYSPLASSPSSYDNFTVSPLAGSPAGATEDARENVFRVTTSGRTIVSPTHVQHGRARSRYASFVRSTSPSVSSSLVAAQGYQANSEFAEMLDELMEAEDHQLDYNNQRSTSDDSWVDDLRRVVDQGLESSSSEGQQNLLDELPGLPGSFPASPASEKRVLGVTDHATPDCKTGVEGLGLELFAQNVTVASTRADQALRALQAIVTEAPRRQNNVSAHSCASDSTHGAQAFLAITTDAIADTVPVKVDTAINTATDDFREYADYLCFVDSPIACSAKPTPAASTNSFRNIPDRLSSPSSIINRPPLPSKSSAVERETLPSRPAARRQDSSVSSRRRSRSRSLLKFVGRRPFSSSSSGFLPTRSSTVFAAPTTSIETGVHRGSTAKARFSSVFAFKSASRSLSVGDTSSSPSDYDDETSRQLGFGQKARPRSASSPPEQQQRSQSAKQQLIEIGADSPSSCKRDLSRGPSAAPAAAKPRTWSFARSRSHAPRRSRSLSPMPSKSSPRDVLFRLRTARNWFWYAITTVTMRTTSEAGSRAKKSTTTKWSATGASTNPYLSVHS